MTSGRFAWIAASSAVHPLVSRVVGSMGRQQTDHLVGQAAGCGEVKGGLARQAGGCWRDARFKPEDAVSGSLSVSTAQCRGVRPASSSCAYEIIVG